jgi:hypothetical protein
MSKWDHVLDQKPRPLEDHLLDEMAKRLTKELAAFPPPIEGLEGPEAARFEVLFEEPRTRPSDDVYRLAFRLARWELVRDIEAVAHFMRNGHYKPVAERPRDYLAMLFISRWLLEQMLALREAVQAKVSRERLVECLEQTERLLLKDPIRA